MKNLIGYLNKTVLLFSLIFFFFANKSPIHAQEGFEITTDFTHSLNETAVHTEVLITVSTDIDRVLTYYTATIPLEDLSVTCFDESDKKIECSTYDNNKATDILIDLDNTVVRSDKPLNIILKYTTTSEHANSYTVSSYIQDTTTNSVTISYPEEKGKPLWSSDPIQNIKGSAGKYTITIQKPNSKSTSLIFGSSVTYQFSVSRVLNNTLTGQNQTFEILIPSDTHNQTVIFDQIDPLPNVSVQDINGNYILKYIVKPGETVNLKIIGYLQMHESVESPDIDSTTLTTTSGYWGFTSKSEIKRVQNYLKNTKGLEIPENFTDISEITNNNTKLLVYKYLNQYVIARLDIQEGVELGVNNTIRLGASSLIEKPSQAGPEDYADFTIAMFRKFNIPARMKIGYISNISGYNADGFYHAWVEIYNTEDKKWIILDPFLEDYTEKTLYGSDFFDHISIITREKSPVSPNLTFYNANDFIVRSETTSTVTPSLSTESELDIDKNNIVNKYINGIISFKNTGNIIITGYEILKSNIDIQTYIDQIQNMNSQILLPKQTINISLNIPEEKFEENIFINLSLKNNNYLHKDILLEDSIETEPVLYLAVLSKLLSLAIGAIPIFLIYSLIQKKIIKT